MRITELAESRCPHCRGELVSEELMNEKKDACYYKVKSRYKVWPSAYASGALVKCRKAGAKNWGSKSKNESVNEVDMSRRGFLKTATGAAVGAAAAAAGLTGANKAQAGAKSFGYWTVFQDDSKFGGPKKPIEAINSLLGNLKYDILRYNGNKLTYQFSREANIIPNSEVKYYFDKGPVKTTRADSNGIVDLTNDISQAARSSKLYMRFQWVNLNGVKITDDKSDPDMPIRLDGFRQVIEYINKYNQSLSKVQQENSDNKSKNESVNEADMSRRGFLGTLGKAGLAAAGAGLVGKAQARVTPGQDDRGFGRGQSDTKDLGDGFELSNVEVAGFNLRAVLDTQTNTYYTLNKKPSGTAIFSTPASYIFVRDGKVNTTMNVGPATAQAMRKAGLIESVNEADLSEHDLIVLPGKPRIRGDVIKSKHTEPDHEVSMAMNSIVSTVKSANTLARILNKRSEQQGLPGWVSDHLTRADELMKDVAEYMEGHEAQKNMLERKNVKR